MAEYFLYFRCWPGFAEPFPFERFNTLPDAELTSALDSFAREQLRIPEVRKQIKEVARGRRRRFIKALNDEWKRRSPASPPVRRWTGHDFRRQCWRRVRGAKREDPLVCRLGSYLGWWTGEKFIGRAVGSPAVWFCLSPSLALAEQVVKELNRQRSLDYDKHDVEYHANPRFGFVSAEGLSLGQRASIQRCINAIREGREPAVQDAKLALEIGQRALAVALDLAKAWPIDEDKELLAALPAPVNSGKTETKTWQEAQAYMEGCRLEGKRFTTYEDMAERVGCSVATVHKAIHKGPVELQEWAAKQPTPSRLNVSPEAAAVALKTTPQSREPDPGDAMEETDVDVCMKFLIEQAKRTSPEAADQTAARIQAMDPADRRALAELTYSDPDRAEQIERHREAKKQERRD